jgi:hypothetical protein
MCPEYTRPAWAQQLREEAANVCSALASIWAAGLANDFSIDEVCTILETPPLARILAEDAWRWAYIGQASNEAEHWALAEAHCRKYGDSLIVIP